MDTIQTLRVKPPQIAQTYLPERLARLDNNHQLLIGTQLASLGRRRFADPHLHNNCQRFLGAQLASLDQRRFADPRLHRAPTIGRGRERSLSSYASREEPKASSPR